MFLNLLTVALFANCLAMMLSFFIAIVTTLRRSSICLPETISYVYLEWLIEDGNTFIDLWPISSLFIFLGSSVSNSPPVNGLYRVSIVHAFALVSMLWKLIEEQIPGKSYLLLLISNLTADGSIGSVFPLFYHCGIMK